jgi:hypothetical protein
MYRDGSLYPTWSPLTTNAKSKRTTKDAKIPKALIAGTGVAAAAANAMNVVKLVTVIALDARRYAHAKRFTLSWLMAAG